MKRRKEQEKKKHERKEEYEHPLSMILDPPLLGMFGCCPHYDLPSQEQA
jgi:hypothetical protein